MDQGEWADALAAAVATTAGAVASAGESDWSAAAGDLAWTCRDTVQHVASDFVGYAGQLTDPRERGYAPVDVVLEGEPGSAGLADVLRATGGMLVSVVRTTPPGTRSWHPYGMAGPCDFAAMGVVEALVHTYDLDRTLTLGLDPDRDLCARALGQLFPDVPAGDDAWVALLWATGRVARGAETRREGWRWANTGR
ncbi:MAG: maleylpyruvate isomerase N-terminal domain-containing protein [Candidatus Nanopelagicales bacterium]